VADLRIEGLLQIGRPGEKCDQPAVIELGMAEGNGGFLTQHGGLYIRPSGRLKNFGRLAITSYHRDSPAAANKGISVFLEKAVDLGDVSIDYLRTGRIVATDDKTAKASAARASFGKHCGAEGDALFSELASIDLQGGQGTVEFVDGLKTDCNILFPHAGRLIVRGKGNRTLQSFDLASLHAVTIDGSRTEFNPKRPLTEKEKELREINALWADVPGKGQAGRYGDQQWPDCPVMIWARPGTSGVRSAGPNWLATKFMSPQKSPTRIERYRLLTRCRRALPWRSWHLDSITLPLPRWISTALKANYLILLPFRLKRLLHLSRLGHLGCATGQNKHC